MNLYEVVGVSGAGHEQRYDLRRWDGAIWVSTIIHSDGMIDQEMLDTAPTASFYIGVLEIMRDQDPRIEIRREEPGNETGRAVTRFFVTTGNCNGGDSLMLMDATWDERQGLMLMDSKGIEQENGELWGEVEDAFL